MVICVFGLFLFGGMLNRILVVCMCVWCLNVVICFLMGCVGLYWRFGIGLLLNKYFGLKIGNRKVIRLLVFIWCVGSLLVCSDDMSVDFRFVILLMSVWLVCDLEWVIENISCVCLMRNGVEFYSDCFCIEWMYVVCWWVILRNIGFIFLVLIVLWCKFL